MSKTNKNTEFDFGNKKADEVQAEQPVVNSEESEKSIDIDQAETQADQPELTNNASDGSEDNKETDKGTKAQKAVVTYVGNGVWRDAEGKCWSRTERADANILSTRSYSQDEYDKRDDIKFMVKYGEMKLTLA